MPVSIAFNFKAKDVEHLVHVSNPLYKPKVGEVIYQFVEQHVGEELAPKITGMLIDIEIETVKAYLKYY